MLSPAAFLAQASLPSASELGAAGTVIIGLAAISVIANQVMSAINAFKKLRGSDPASDSRYATKEEHNSLAGDVSELKGQMTSFGTTLNAEFRAINRSLGRLEGAAGTVPKNQHRD